jgi:uracil-DNA glycosylase family 4
MATAKISQTLDKTQDKTRDNMSELLAPGRDCAKCPRLVAYREASRAAQPSWHNAPVQSIGPIGARLLIAGLAPGMKGANRTGRPFTGDYAGDLLFPTLTRYGFAEGVYGRAADDGMRLVDCRITNAVRCVPPQNKPIGAEVLACRPFLLSELAAMTELRVILALGGIAHQAILRTLGCKVSAHKFAHCAQFTLPSGPILIDSYHCSRLNTNTGRLTEAMFHQVFEDIREVLGSSD